MDWRTTIVLLAVALAPTPAHGLADRGGSVMGLVPPPRAQMQGAPTSAMPTRIVKEGQRRRCALGGGTLRASGIYGRLAASQLLPDVASIASSSLLALTRNSHLPDPSHFHHGLLEGRQARGDAQQEDSGDKDKEGATNDGRRTLRRLPANLARGTVGVFSAHNLVPLLAGAAGAGLSTRLDDELAQPDGRESGFGVFFDTVGNPILVGIVSVGALAAGRLARGQQFRDSSYDLLVAATVNYLYTGALKLATNRTRPDGSNDASFPSGHTSAMFALATVLDRHYGMMVGVPGYFVASLVGASRINRGAHFLSDVVAGAAIGFIVGRTVVRQNDAPLEAPRFSLQPAVGPSGQRGLIVMIRF